MAYIVSRNYINLFSRFRWMVREENQSPHLAVKCLSVLATGVKFVATMSGDESAPNFPYERGFGCGMVAVCDFVEVKGVMDPETGLSVDGFEPGESFPDAEDGFEKIIFNGVNFQSVGDYLRPPEYLYGAHSLYLRPDGKVFRGVVRDLVNS